MLELLPSESIHVEKVEFRNRKLISQARCLRTQSLLEVTEWVTLMGILKCSNFVCKALLPRGNFGI